MVAVKPETDEEHLRLRAWWSVWARRSANKPVREEDIARLVINGGKRTAARKQPATPTAA